MFAMRATGEQSPCVRCSDEIGSRSTNAAGKVNSIEERADARMWARRGSARPLDCIPCERIQDPRSRVNDLMKTEKITVRVTESGQTLDVVVFSKRADRIEVVFGEGIHNVKCALTPTRNGLAYVGSVMGREVVYVRSREQVQADIDRVNPTLRGPRRR
jgi:hypothetical protein